MPGKNTTGKPNTSDYVLGRGVPYFATLDANGLPSGGYRDLGNCPEFNISIEIETLDHASSRAGLKATDKSVVISQKATASFTLDELNFQNIALFFGGTVAAYTNPSIAGFAQWVMVPDGSLQLGAWYDITNSSNARAYDTAAADLTITTNEGSPQTMVLGTDYELDQPNGRIFILSTSTKAAASIAAVKGLKVTLAARAGAKVVTQVKGLQTSAVTGALKFVLTNPADNDNVTEVQFHQISLKPEGDFSLVSDEWTSMGFTGAAEKNTKLSGQPTITFSYAG